MFEILKGKKVLVTGGAGFIGSHMVDRLLELGSKVIVVDNLLTGNINNIEHNLSKIEFIEEDFSSEEFLNKHLKGIDYISHQAALRSVPKSVEIPFDYHQVNVTGTLRLLLKARDFGIKRMVFASSSSVYGQRFDFPEKESDYPRPVSPYAASKLLGEVYAYLFTELYRLPVVSLRYFNVFGPRQSLENQYAVVVPKFITCLLQGERPPVYGDGNQERDFTYIENVVEANILALVKDKAIGEIFNVASSNPQSVNSLLRALKEITGINIEPQYLDERPGDVQKTQADINKTTDLLGWQPKIDFYQGLKHTVNWFKENKVKESK
ncbi:MAG: SDR family oxidoreductase [Candidatus Omnitrophica bacterium]|nr:SDR family oxidoreductase [Candidatus Omnitrophota bacterium]